MAPDDPQAFIERVRQSAAKTVASHVHDPRPVTGDPGRTPADKPLADLFVERAEATGMSVARAKSVADAREEISAWLSGRGIATAVCWDTPELRDLAQALDDVEVSFWNPDSADLKSSAFAMACGITTVDHAVAETGSLVVSGKAEDGRSVTMLGEYHVALVYESQIVPDLYDLFPALRADNPDRLPPCISLITGPSKTADIELQLVVGVHGPGEVHIVLVES